MKKLIICLAFLASLTGLRAQLEFVELIDIEAIQSMEYYQPASGVYRAKVVAIFANNSNRDVKLDNGDFLVSIRSDKTQAIHLGRGAVNNLIIPAGKKQAYELDIFVGHGSGDDVITRMMAIFNVIADPQQRPIMILDGECGFGAKLSRGWATSNSVSIEFEFTPKLQNEVLFQ